MSSRCGRLPPSLPSLGHWLAVRRAPPSLPSLGHTRPHADTYTYNTYTWQVRLANRIVLAAPLPAALPVWTPIVIEHREATHNHPGGLSVTVGEARRITHLPLNVLYNPQPSCN